MSKDDVRVRTPQLLLKPKVYEWSIMHAKKNNRAWNNMIETIIENEMNKLEGVK